MSALPEHAVVLGSGAGALTIAAELGLAGVEVTVADFPEFAANLEPVRAAGSVELRADGAGPVSAPIASTSSDPAVAARGAPVLIVSVPSFAHEPFARALAPVLEDGQTLLWPGEGGGAFTTKAALRAIGRRPELALGETNTLPYGTRVTGPGVVTAVRKRGGTLVSALPASAGDQVFATASAIWPWARRAENAWETVLVNFNAIDHVATVLLNLGSVEGRDDRMLLWGEGATPGVVNAIEGVDRELLALRAALGLTDRTTYAEYLVAQGLVDGPKATLHETIHASDLAVAEFQCGVDALQSRYLTEDVPFALVLYSSLGAELGVETPLIDGLITLAATVTGTDWRARGRTLASWGMTGGGVDLLRRAAREGSW